MPCYHPITAWRCASGVFFKPTPDSSTIQLPCGRCIGCRLERSRQWALRLTHELRFHEDSCFITLTYKPKFLPPGGSLQLSHFQLFMKRLRKDSSNPIRFFHCGEYGEKLGRPHYHAIIFGRDFRTGVYDSQRSERGDLTWSSTDLDRLWSDPSSGECLGMSRIGAVTFESCAYVARYVCKKVTGLAAERHYERFNFFTGEIYSLKPEYATMSRRPGIGFQHFSKYASSIYPLDRVISRGHPSKPPRFYDRCLDKADPLMYLQIKEAREFALTASSKSDKSESRLAVREAVKLAQIGHLSRRYEIG